MDTSERSSLIFKFFKIIIFYDKINYKTKEIHEIVLRIKIT